MDVLKTTTMLFGVKVVAALLLMLVGYRALRWSSREVQQVMTRRHTDALLAEFAGTALTACGVVILVLAALQLVGVPTTSFLAVLGTAGLAIGLALKDSLSHLAAGVMLMVLRPFRAGHAVKAAGQEGNVAHVRLFQTVLRTADNRVITLPNGSIIAEPIVNYSDCSTRRIDLSVLLAVDAPAAAAIASLRKLAECDVRIHKQPAPSILATDLSDRGLAVQIQVWSDAAVMGDVRSDLLSAIQSELPASGCRLVGPGAVPPVTSTPST